MPLRVTEHGIECLKKAARDVGNVPFTEYAFDTVLRKSDINLPVYLVEDPNAQIPAFNDSIVAPDSGGDESVILNGIAGFKLVVKKVTAKSSTAFYVEVILDSTSIESLIGEPRKSDKVEFDGLVILEGQSLKLKRYNLGEQSERIYTAIHYSKKAV